MRNRHIPSSIVEVWDSYEWLVRRKLEELDHLTRQMYKDMQMTRSKQEDIREFIPMAFAELWDNVAEEQERGGRGARSSAV